jgi:F-type H+-transporting ATPase subunit a
MITNLFSSFDPSSSILKMRWLYIALPLILLPSTIGKIKQAQEVTLSKVKETIRKEVKYATTNLQKGTRKMMVTLLIILALINLVALYPQIFSVTAQLSINAPLALTCWLTAISYGWLKKTQHMLAHTLPQGTPVALMNFMVLIETTRVIIRPLTLCVRLTANMIAGHLLMTLLGNAITSRISTINTPLLLAPISLTVLETAVAIIQAYVLATLVTLYSAEVSYDK